MITHANDRVFRFWGFLEWTIVEDNYLNHLEKHSAEWLGGFYFGMFRLHISDVILPRIIHMIIINDDNYRRLGVGTVETYSLKKPVNTETLSESR